MDEREIIWLAGLLEGEGYFAMRKDSKTKREYPAIVVAMNDQDIVERVANMFGTKASFMKRRQPQHSDYYRCIITAGGAIEWIQAVFPYMGERRKTKIREIILEWEAMKVDMTKSRIKRKPYVGFIDTATPQIISDFARGLI